METKATRTAFGETLMEIADKYPQIVTLDADLSGSVKTAAFAKKYPNRSINLGVSEADMIGTSAGMAHRGRIPFACTFALFVTGRAWEQVRNSLAYPNMNVKLIGSHGGIATGPDGASHQATEDFAIMRVLPNMKVFCPADATETKMLIKAVVEDHGPCYIRTGRPNVPILFDENYKFEIGKGNVIKKGTDITIIAIGPQVYYAIEAAKKLEAEGYSVGVINMCSLKPIDKKLIIETAKNTNLIVTAEDHNIIGGLGSAVAEVLAENSTTKLFRIGMHHFGESGTTENLYKKYRLDSNGIYEQIKEMI